MSGADEEEADFTQDVEANGEFDEDRGQDGEDNRDDSRDDNDHDGDDDVEPETKVEVKAEGNNGSASFPTAGEDEDGAPGTGTDHIPRGTDDNAGEDRKLFIGGLSWETREPQLKEYFEKFGEVESVNLKLDPMTGKSRCFAFVVYKDPADLSAVFAAGEHAINSKKVDVKKARAKPGKLFIGGLKPEMTDEQIREYFEQFGTIVEFEMPFDKIKKQRKGFGFITFEREETMKDLIKRSKVTIGEHEVDLRKATPKPDYNTPFRGGGGGAGGGGGGGGYGSSASYMGGAAASAGDYYGGGYGDYYGAYASSGSYADYYSQMGGGGWGAYGGGYGMPPSGGGKMRGGGAVGRGGGGGGVAKRGGAPY